MRSSSYIRQVLIFLFVFICLQALWAWQRHSLVCTFFVEGLTVKSAVNIVNLLTPSVMALAKGTSIAAEGGGINVYSGCEGVEVMFMLMAAMLIAPISLRAKLLGTLSGLIFIFMLNQIRLVCLFYVVRVDKNWFELAHGFIAPIALVALTALFFAYWLAKNTNKIQIPDTSIG